MRSGWIDVARGLSILLVVMLHSSLGVSKVLGAPNWLEHIVAFAKPFRMPAFFILTGMLSVRADSFGWRDFIDRKLIRFIYFYFLWAYLILLIKNFAPSNPDGTALAQQAVNVLIEPSGSLWYIYLLPILFLTARIFGKEWTPAGLLLAIPLHLLASGHLAEDRFALMSTWTGRMALDSYALFLVFFMGGRFFRAQFELLANWVPTARGRAAILITLWGGANLFFLKLGLIYHTGGLLLAGFTGAAALVMISALISDNRRFQWLAYCGRHALPIYLAFVLPMGVIRTILIDVGWLTSGTIISLVVWAGAIGFPLLLEFLVRGTRASFLFSRPDWARIEPVLNIRDGNRK